MVPAPFALWKPGPGTASVRLVPGPEKINTRLGTENTDRDFFALNLCLLPYKGSIFMLLSRNISPNIIYVQVK